MDTSKLMVSVSGVRGRVGDGLTPEVISHFGARPEKALKDIVPL